MNGLHLDLPLEVGLRLARVKCYLGVNAEWPEMCGQSYVFITVRNDGPIGMSVTHRIHDGTWLLVSDM